MAWIKNFKSDTVWKAFVLNAAANSLIIIFALTIKSHLDIYRDKDNNESKLDFSWFNTFITFAVTFMAAFAGYTILYILTGFGGGMLVNNAPLLK